jgi:hypothetical protein
MADSPEALKNPSNKDDMENVAEEIVRDMFSAEQENECRELLADLIEEQRSKTEEIEKYKTWILFLGFYLLGTTFHSPNAAREAVPSIFSELGLTHDILLSGREFLLVVASALMTWSIVLQGEVQALSAIKKALIERGYPASQQPLRKAIYDATSQALLWSHRFSKQDEKKLDKKKLLRTGLAVIGGIGLLLLDFALLFIGFCILFIWVAIDIVRYPVVSIWVSFIFVFFALLHLGIGISAMMAIHRPKPD